MQGISDSKHITDQGNGNQSTAIYPSTAQIALPLILTHNPASLKNIRTNNTKFNWIDHLKIRALDFPLSDRQKFNANRTDEISLHSQKILLSALKYRPVFQRQDNPPLKRLFKQLRQETKEWKHPPTRNPFKENHLTCNESVYIPFISWLENVLNIYEELPKNALDLNLFSEDIGNKLGIENTLQLHLHMYQTAYYFSMHEKDIEKKHIKTFIRHLQRIIEHLIRENPKIYHSVNISARSLDLSKASSIWIKNLESSYRAERRKKIISIFAIGVFLSFSGLIKKSLFETGNSVMRSEKILEIRTLASFPAFIPSTSTIEELPPQISPAPSLTPTAFNFIPISSILGMGSMVLKGFKWINKNRKKHKDSSLESIFRKNLSETSLESSTSEEGSQSQESGSFVEKDMSSSDFYGKTPTKHDNLEKMDSEKQDSSDYESYESNSETTGEKHGDVIRLMDDSEIYAYNRRIVPADHVKDKINQTLAAANTTEQLNVGQNSFWNTFGKKMLKMFALSDESSYDCLQNKVGIAYMQGRRLEMEDAHLAIILKISVKGKIKSVPLFAIFDGHGGNQCSNYLEQQLPKYLERHLPKALSQADPDAAIFNLLKTAFVYLGESYRKKVPNFQGQSAAVVVMIIDDVIWTGCCGDSRAILSLEDFGALALSEDAKPYNLRFYKGILKRGGEVYNHEEDETYRVYKDDDQLGLAMARAVGHHEVLSSINPRSKVLKLINPEGQNYLVLACDGLWDVVSSIQVANFIQESAKAKKSPLVMSQQLVRRSYACLSQDNISVIVVDLSFLKGLKNDITSRKEATSKNLQLLQTKESRSISI